MDTNRKQHRVEYPNQQRSENVDDARHRLAGPAEVFQLLRIRGRKGLDGSRQGADPQFAFLLTVSFQLSRD